MNKTFKIFSREFGFTYILDKTCGYTIGCINITDNGIIDNQVYWHKLLFGLFIRSDNWKSKRMIK